MECTTAKAMDPITKSARGCIGMAAEQRKEAQHVQGKVVRRRTKTAQTHSQTMCRALNRTLAERIKISLFGWCTMFDTSWLR